MCSHHYWYFPATVISFHFCLQTCVVCRVLNTKVNPRSRLLLLLLLLLLLDGIQMIFSASGDWTHTFLRRQVESETIHCSCSSFSTDTGRELINKRNCSLEVKKVTVLKCVSLSACFFRSPPTGEMNVGPLVIICLVQTEMSQQILHWMLWNCVSHFSQDQLAKTSSDCSSARLGSMAANNNTSWLKIFITKLVRPAVIDWTLNFFATWGQQTSCEHWHHSEHFYSFAPTF